MTEAEATNRIQKLEAALDRGAAELLEIGPADGVPDLCLAFASAATQYHPSRFAGLNAAIVQRATLAYARLRAQFQQQVAELQDRRPRERQTTRGRLHHVRGTSRWD